MPLERGNLPVPPTSSEGILEYLGALDQHLRQNFEQIDENLFTETNVAPTKTDQGMLRYADGTNWDPGDGAGLYQFNGSAWVRLMQGSEGDYQLLTGKDAANGYLGLTSGSKPNNGWGRLTYLQQAVANGDSSIDFFITPDAYEAYLITAHNWHPSADCRMEVRFSVDGSTFEAGADDYDWLFMYIGAVTGSQLDSNDASADSIAMGTTSANYTLDSDASDSGHFALWFFPDTSAATYRGGHVIWQQNHISPAEGMVAIWGMGAMLSGPGGDANGIQFLQNTGNIDLGKFTLYGLADG